MRAKTLLNQNNGLFLFASPFPEAEALQELKRLGGERARRRMLQTVVEQPVVKLWRGVGGHRGAVAFVERFDIEPYSDFQPNEQTLEGSFSSVSTPNFASKYSLESS